MQKKIQYNTHFVDIRELNVFGTTVFIYVIIPKGRR